MISEIEFAELLQSRIFHDLSGPIGAMSNGAEFLTETKNDLYNKAVGLLKSSSVQAVARLQYFKYTFGFLHNYGEINVTKIQSLVAGFHNNPRLTFEWESNKKIEETIVYNIYAKILLNALLVVSSSLVYGGNININLNITDDKCAFTIKGTTNNQVKIDRDNVQILSEKNYNLNFNSQNITALYLDKIIQLINGKFNFEFTNNSVSIDFSFKPVKTEIDEHNESSPAISI